MSSQTKRSGLPPFKPTTVLLFILTVGPLLYVLMQLIPVNLTSATTFLTTLIGLSVGLGFWGFYRRSSLRSEQAN